MLLGTQPSCCLAASTIKHHQPPRMMRKLIQYQNYTSISLLSMPGMIAYVCSFMSVRQIWELNLVTTHTITGLVSKPKVITCSADGTTIWASLGHYQYRTLSEIPGLAHQPRFDSTFQLCFRTWANLYWLSWGAYVLSSFHGLAHCKASGRGQLPCCRQHTTQNNCKVFRSTSKIRLPN